jgi:uncharacterized phage infection (PIP) family protein YhgE
MNRIAKTIGVVALAGASFLAGGTLAAQSSLQRALDHLQAARNELEQGGKDKGGYRKDALALVTQAIESVRKGIEHERKKKD